MQNNKADESQTDEDPYANISLQQTQVPEQPHYNTFSYCQTKQI
jgi:hypothetical protein